MSEKVQMLTSVLCMGMNAYDVDSTIATKLIPSQLAIDGNPISCIPEGNIVLWIF